MRVYIDSSAVIKRVLVEPESEALAEQIDEFYRQSALLVSTTLARTEVARALRNAMNVPYKDVADDVFLAMLGVAERPLDAEIMNLARRVEPNQLPSLDALHLAGAVALDVDVMMTYDAQLAAAAKAHGMKVSAPGANHSES